MAKRRKRSSSKCPEPFNTMLDIAGAVAMGAYARNKVKKDYARGQGRESIGAATAVFGMGSMRRGTQGMVSLGGLIGVNSAIKDIEKQEQAQRNLRIPAYDSGIDVHSYKVNDNRYAWRLNCEDGSAYGIVPEDFETREEYNAALRAAKYSQRDFCVNDAGDDIASGNGESGNGETDSPETSEDDALLLCRVSLLSNGKTECFRTNDSNIKCGDIVIVPYGEGTTQGVVVAIEMFSSDACMHPLDEMPSILKRQQ